MNNSNPSRKNGDPLYETWKKIHNNVVAVIFNSLLILVLIPIMGMIFKDSSPWVVIIATTVLEILLVWYPGYLYTPIGWRSVITFAGGRVKPLFYITSEDRKDGFYWVLDEGWLWLPPWVMGGEGVNVKERTMVVNDVEVPSKDSIRMLPDTTLQYKIVDPHLLLQIGLSAVEKGLHDLVSDTVRQLAHQNSAAVLYRFEKVDFNKPVSDACDREGALTRWGIDVVSVLLKKILPLENKVSEAFELETVEQRQKPGEKVERAFNIESIEAYKKTGLSPDAAAAMHAGERGKNVKISVRRIEVDSTDPMTQAAAVVNDGLAAGKDTNGGDA
jgi:regulator of protease activity HflC (stomatin/prohibitin superfamily)